MIVKTTLSLDEETVRTLEKKSKELNLPMSAIVRVLVRRLRDDEVHVL
jgi:hypothetical protein